MGTPEEWSSASPGEVHRTRLTGQLVNNFPILLPLNVLGEPFTNTAFAGRFLANVNEPLTFSIHVQLTGQSESIFV